MGPLPTLRQLQFFLALSRRKSFSKAAEDCLVSQSTLSSAIKELEALLGCQLVDRSTRAFALTPAGEEAAARAGPLLTQVEDLVRMTSQRRSLHGAFHLGVIPTIAPFLLPRSTTLLQCEYPSLDLFLREDLSANLADRLANGLLDAIILALPFDVPGADIIELGNDTFWLAAPAGHPLSTREEIRTEELRNTNLLLLEDGHCLRDHAISACHLQPPSTASAFGATSLFTLMQMVQTGLGVTLLPDMAVRAGIANGGGLSVVRLAKPAPSRKIGLAWRRGSGRRQDAEAIAEIFRRVLDEQSSKVTSSIVNNTPDGGGRLRR